MEATAELERLRQQNEAARLKLETAQLQEQASLIDAIPKLALMEAWGDVVDTREWRYDDPNFVPRSDGRYSLSTIQDREDGRDRVLFETEWDLARIRGIGQTLCAFFPAALNIQQNLTNYTIGTGFGVRAQSAENVETDPEFVEAVQFVVDTFTDDNNFRGDLDRELRDRTSRDGEWFLALRPRGWRTVAEVIEPACVTEPTQTRDLDAWLSDAFDDDFVSSWSFGVHTRADCPGRPLGYHVKRDPEGKNWDYFATDLSVAKRIGSGVAEHFKTNVDRNVKRGVSDYLAAYQFLEHSEKLLKNTAVGASIQAAIAFIRQHATTTSAAGGSGLPIGNAVATRQQPTQAGGTRTRYAQHYHPGTILDISAGLEYQAGPLGSERAPNFIAVIQAALRYVGIRFCMPEGMISGDNSNNNYASALVGEAPFVKSREADQHRYKGAFERIYWTAIRIAFEAGRFAKWVDSWEALCAAIDLLIMPPTVASRDPKARAETAAAEIAAGYLSRRTACEESGRDFDKERENKERDGDPAPVVATVPAGGVAQGDGAQTATTGGTPQAGPQAAPAGDGAVEGGGAAQAIQVTTDAVLNGAQIMAARTIVADVAAGVIPRDAGLGQLRVLFNLDADKALEIMGSAGTSTPTTPNPSTRAGTPTIEAVVESIRTKIAKRYP